MLVTQGCSFKLSQTLSLKKKKDEFAPSSEGFKFKMKVLTELCFLGKSSLPLLAVHVSSSPWCPFTAVCVAALSVCSHLCRGTLNKIEKRCVNYIEWHKHQVIIYKMALLRGFWGQL